MKSTLALLIVAAFAIGVGCGKKACADGVTTGDRIPVEVNSIEKATTAQ